MKNNLLIVTLMPVLLYGQAALDNAQQMVQVIDALHTELIDKGYRDQAWCSAPATVVIPAGADAALAAFDAWQQQALFSHKAADGSCPYIRAVMLAGLVPSLSDLAEAIKWANAYYKALAITGGSSGVKVIDNAQIKQQLTNQLRDRASYLADVVAKIASYDANIAVNRAISISGMNNANTLEKQKKDYQAQSDHIVAQMDAAIKASIQTLKCSGSIKVQPNAAFNKQITVASLLNQTTAAVAQQIIGRDDIISFLGQQFPALWKQEFTWLQSFVRLKFPAPQPTVMNAATGMSAAMFVASGLGVTAGPSKEPDHARHQAVQDELTRMMHLAGTK